MKIADLSWRARRLIAGLEVLGGVSIIGGSSVGFFQNSSALPLWWITGSWLLGCYAVAAGVLLWKVHRFGRWLSIGLQLLQVFQVATTSFLFKLIVGPQIILFWGIPNWWQMFFGFAGSFGIWGEGHTQPIGLGINLWAFVSLIILIMDRGPRKELAS